MNKRTNREAGGDKQLQGVNGQTKNKADELTGAAKDDRDKLAAAAADCRRVCGASWIALRGIEA